MSNLLTLANTPGTITCRGASHERDSTIDLAWFNKAAVLAVNFSNLEIDWEGSLGLDHALLKVKGQAHNDITDLLEEPPCRFVINPEKHKAWVASFCNLTKPPLLPPSPSAEEIEVAAEALVRLIDQTNKATFCKRQPLHPKAAPWWNTAYATAVQNLRDAQDPDTRHTEHQHLKGAVKQAKQEWAEECIEKEQLWDVMNWIHRHCLTKVPSLQGAEGLAHSHDEIANVLSQQFFPCNPPVVNTHFPDDPPPHIPPGTCPSSQDRK